jgi:hypothetical protein
VEPQPVNWPQPDEHTLQVAFETIAALDRLPFLVTPTVEPMYAPGELLQAQCGYTFGADEVKTVWITHVQYGGAGIKHGWCVLGIKPIRYSPTGQLLPMDAP